MATVDDGLVVQEDATGSISVFDETGQLASTSSPGVGDASYTRGTLIGLSGGATVSAEWLGFMDATVGLQADNRTGQSAAYPIRVDNFLGTETLLVRREGCELGFREIPPHGTSTEQVDGAKPAKWHVPGTPQYTQDWFKVMDRLGVRIKSDGEPEKFMPVVTPATLATYAVGDCNFDNPVCTLGYWTNPWCGSTGGRKKECEWSDHFSDWRWLPDWELDRKQSCATNTYRPPSCQ